MIDNCANMAGHQVKIIIQVILILHAAVVVKSYCAGTWGRSASQSPPTYVFLKASDTFPTVKQRVTFTLDWQQDSFTIHTVEWYKDGEQLSGWPRDSLTHTLTVTAADSGSYMTLCTFVLGHGNLIYINSSAVQVLVYNNIAQGKPTRQSGLIGRSWASENAVDGNKAHVRDSICAIAGVGPMSTKPVWWSVDLSAGDKLNTFVIESVGIVFSKCCPERISGISVLVGYDDKVDTHKECARITSGDFIQTLPCRPATPIRFLTVMHPTNRYLNLCEVLVNGYSLNKPSIELVWLFWWVVGLGISVLIIIMIIITPVIIIKRRKARLTNGKFDIKALAAEKVHVVANVYQPFDVIQALSNRFTEQGHPIEDPLVYDYINAEHADVTEPLYQEIGEKILG